MRSVEAAHQALRVLVEPVEPVVRRVPTTLVMPRVATAEPEPTSPPVTREQAVPVEPHPPITAVAHRVVTVVLEARRRSPATAAPVEPAVRQRRYLEARPRVPPVATVEQAATPRVVATVALEALAVVLRLRRQEPRPQPADWVQPAATSMPVDLAVVVTVERAETLS